MSVVNDIIMVKGELGYFADRKKLRVSADRGGSGRNILAETHINNRYGWAMWIAGNSVECVKLFDETQLRNFYISLFLQDTFHSFVSSFFDRVQAPWQCPA